MAKDWKAAALASGLKIPAADLDRIAQPLNALEETFRPLTADLTPDMEPCLLFQPEEEQ